MASVPIDTDSTDADGRGNRPDHYLETELKELARRGGVIEFLDRCSLDGLWFWDLENPDDEWMSPRFWKLLGYDPAEKSHLAIEWQNLVDPEDLEEAKQLLAAHIADPNIPYDCEMRYRHAGGSFVWVRCRGVAIRDADGKARRVLGSHTDLTPMKRAEQRAASLVRTLPGIVLVLSEAGKYLEVRSSESDQLRVVEDELLGRNVRDVLGESVGKGVIAAIGDALASGEPKMHRYIAAAGGVRRQMEARVAPLPDGFSGLERSVVWVANDISERVRAEDRLQQSHAELERFAYVVSHDLRAPLRGLNHLSEWIGEEVGDAASVDLKDYLRLMRDRVQRMDGLVSGILKYSRAAGECTLERVDPKPIFIKAWQAIAAGEGFELLLPERLPQLSVDPLLFEQVAQNLLHNAVDHHDQASGTVSVSVDVGAEEVKVHVDDDGPGVPARARRRVFDLFQQLSSRGASSKSSAEGAAAPDRAADEAKEESVRGIGLSIVKKSVERMGGTVAAMDAPGGRGARFSISLPLLALSGHAARPDAGSPDVGPPDAGSSGLGSADPAAPESQVPSGSQTPSK
ncbi:MAG: ATP-binding protein [Planctomycetota bacterium]